MSSNPRQKLYLAMATGIFVSHLVVAALAKPSFGLTMYGDSVACALVLLAMLAIRENLRNRPGILPIFWKVFAGGLATLLLSQLFWFYFDYARLRWEPSPVLGDSLFLLAHVFFLSALALRPHSSSARLDLRIRALDFVLLSLWWLCLYGYFALPWQILVHNLNLYNRDFYVLAFLEHLVIVGAVAVLSARKRGRWRWFYLHLAVAFSLIAAGNLILSMAIDSGKYYAGGFYDTAIFLGMYLLTAIARFGSSLQPYEDATPHRELAQSVWTARIAMLVVVSLPAMALSGLYLQTLPHRIEVFRLRLVFALMFILSGLVYWKLNLLSRELVHLVRLTRDSIENLKAVQDQVSHSEKFVALGRLAAGAAHEISNPLTAILGYSELLTDIPSLAPEDRAQAQQIREQVHRAQAAVTSLRNTLRQTSSPLASTVDKTPVS